MQKLMSQPCFTHSQEQQWATLRDLKPEIVRVKELYDNDNSLDGSIVRAVLKSVIWELENSHIPDEEL